MPLIECCPMPITSTEADQIAQKIRPLLSAVASKYDFMKYPADEYGALKDQFAAMTATHESIERALVWKWGHWGKPNYPEHHRRLIAEIQGLWSDFSKSGAIAQPHDTFEWWQGRLGRSTTYITSTFITHLVHHERPLPIIDQHNYRAMNALIASVRPGHGYKKKPSNWSDIASLKSFMVLLCERLPGVGFGDLDRFLMVYGSKHVAR